MLDSLNRNFLQIDSLSYYAEDFPELEDSVPAHAIRQVSPDVVYGSHSILQASVKNENHLSHLIGNPKWEGWLALGIIFIFLLSFRYLLVHLRHSISSLLSFHALQKQFKENSLLMRNIRQVLLLFSLLILSFCFYLIISEYARNAPVEAWQLYSIVLGTIVAYLLLKTFCMWLIGLVSKSLDALLMLNYSGQLYIIACSLLLFPVSIMLLLGTQQQSLHTLILVIGIICGLGLIFYFIRSFQIFYKAKFSIFFWFLYLCTFEIVPFIVLYRCFLAN